VLFNGCPDVRDSASLAGCIKKSGILPPVMSNILEGAASGEDFSQGFKKMSGFFQEKIEAFFNAAILVVEPAVIAVLGLLGTGILIALYLPSGLR
jgi:type II secretory pathway component PulF